MRIADRLRQTDDRCRMTMTSTVAVHQGWRGRLHGELRRAGVPLGHRPGAGRARAKPGRAVPERRQRRAQHGGALRQPGLLPASADDCGAGGQRAADWHRRRRHDGGAPPSSHRPQAGVRRRPSRGRPAQWLSELEPLAFPGHRHLVTADPGNRRALAGSVATSNCCRSRSTRSRAGTPCARHRGRCSRASSACPPFPIRAPTRSAARTRATRRCSRARPPPASPRMSRSDRPHLSFVSGTARAAFDTLDRVASVAQYTPTVTYPGTGLGSALRAVAGSMVRGIGTRVFWVQTGGFDTHAPRIPTRRTAPTTG